MRAVFVGAGSLAIMTANLLIKRKHEVVIIEKDKQLIDDLSETMDCGFLLGDGSKPALQKEAAPADTDLLFCLTDNDTTNILASLVGKSLGFKRIVTKIVDPELEHICIELKLDDTIIPARTIGRYLADMFEGRDPLELSTMIRDEARVVSLVIPEDFTGTLADLTLPKNSRAICLYRDQKFIIANDELELKADDELVVITHRDNVPIMLEH